MINLDNIVNILDLSINESLHEFIDGGESLLDGKEEEINGIEEYCHPLAGHASDKNTDPIPFYVSKCEDYIWDDSVSVIGVQQENETVSSFSDCDYHDKDDTASCETNNSCFVSSPPDDCDYQQDNDSEYYMSTIELTRKKLEECMNRTKQSRSLLVEHYPKMVSLLAAAGHWNHDVVSAATATEIVTKGENKNDIENDTSILGQAMLQRPDETDSSKTGTAETCSEETIHEPRRSGGIKTFSRWSRRTTDDNGPKFKYRLARQSKNSSSSRKSKKRKGRTSTNHERETSSKNKRKHTSVDYQRSGVML